MGARTARGTRRLAPRAERTSLGCGLALVTGVAVLSVIMLVAFFLFTVLPRGGSPAAAVIQTQPGAATWNSGERTTMLLVSRADGSNAPATGFTALSYQPATRALTVLSIPANLWVTVPGFGQAPLGQAYADGGVRLTLLTAQSVLGMPIPYYAIAGAQTLAKIIDGLGGVTVPTAGPTRLDGSEAEAYIQRNGGDAGQRVLLATLGRTQTSDNRLRLPSLLNSLGPSIATNFPLSQVPDLVRALAAVDTGQTLRAAIGAESGTALPYTSGGMHLYLPRWDRIRTLARRLLGMSRLSGSVDVLNGTNVPGQAAALASWLHSSSIPVRRYATAPPGNYPRTKIVVRPGASAGDLRLAETAAELLQVPITSGTISARAAPVAVIIGRDFQDPTQQ